MAIGTTAAIIAGLIAAGGSVASSVIQSKAAGKAANTQVQAAQQAGTLGKEATMDANAILKAIYEGDLTRLQPYFDAGSEGLSQLVAGMKEGGYFDKEFPQFQFGEQQFKGEPGYEFRLSQGQQAVDRSLAARGKALSGAGVKESMRYNQGFASNEYGNAYNRALQGYQTNFNAFKSQLDDRYSRLLGLVNMGAGATDTAINMGQNYAARTSGNIMEGARLGTEALAGAANARASGYIGQANAVSSGIGGMTNALSQAALLAGMNKKNPFVPEKP